MDNTKKHQQHNQQQPKPLTKEEILQKLVDVLTTYDSNRIDPNTLSTFRAQNQNTHKQQQKMVR